MAVGGAGRGSPSEVGPGRSILGTPCLRNAYSIWVGTPCSCEVRHMPQGAVCVDSDPLSSMLMGFGCESPTRAFPLGEAPHLFDVLRGAAAGLHEASLDCYRRGHGVSGHNLARVEMSASEAFHTHTQPESALPGPGLTLCGSSALPGTRDAWTIWSARQLPTAV